MMIFLMVFVSIICFCTGLLAGLFITVHELEVPKRYEEKRKPELSYETELKNFFDYDGTSQDI